MHRRYKSPRSLGASTTAALLFSGLVGCTGSIDPADDDLMSPGSSGVPGQPHGGMQSAAGSGTTPGGGNTNVGLGGAGGGVDAGPSAGTAGSGPPPRPAASPRIARLTHFQWRNAVQDLLRLDAPPAQADSFPTDAVTGFDTDASQLRMSSTLRDDYQSAAEALARQVATNSSALAKLIPASAPTEAKARAEAFVQTFGRRAYRRPLTAAEVSQYITLFDKGPQLAPDLDAFAAGAMLVMQTILQSPHFLYRTELSQQSNEGKVALNGYEVAAKLALAVTGSIPDDALLDAAAAGALEPGMASASVSTHAERLLATPRAKATALHLHTQALAVSRYALILRETENYPEFTGATPASLRKSAELFLGSIYDQNLGLKGLLTSPEVFVDANLAKIYGLTGTQFGTDFTKVDLSAQSRRGFLTQAGFLALFSGEHQPDPIHRGVFINEQVLCVSVGVPIPNIPPLPDPQPNQTNRQRIDAVTGVGTCGQGCHATLINPLGFAFENYDPLARHRTMDNGAP
ncbi:MAG TPA: DUF1592 domain-containing protein, partial [Polyangiaceae bacterium]